MLTRVLTVVVGLSVGVCECVCHTPVLCQNGWFFLHTVFLDSCYTVF